MWVPIAQEALPVCLIPMTRVKTVFAFEGAIGIAVRGGRCDHEPCSNHHHRWRKTCEMPLVVLSRIWEEGPGELG